MRSVTTLRRLFGARGDALNMSGHGVVVSSSPLLAAHRPLGGNMARMSSAAGERAWNMDCGMLGMGLGTSGRSGMDCGMRGMAARCSFLMNVQVESTCCTHRRLLHAFCRSFPRLPGHMHYKTLQCEVDADAYASDLSLCGEAFAAHMVEGGGELQHRFAEAAHNCD